MGVLSTDLLMVERSGTPYKATAAQVGAPRVSSAASAASITPAIETYDTYDLTAQAVALTINNPTGTPYNLQRLAIRITDNGVERALSWGDSYRRVSDVNLPASTLASKVLIVELCYHAGLSLWLCVTVSVSNQSLSNIEFVGANFWAVPGKASGSDTIDLTTYFTGGLALTEGDFVLVGVSAVYASVAMESAGWTDETGAITGTDDIVTNLRVYSKFMGPSPDSSVQIAATTNATWAQAIMVRAYRGVSISTPMDVAGTTASGGNSALANPPSNTPAHAGSVGVVFASAGTNSSELTFASPDLNEFITGWSPDGAGSAAGSGHKYLTGVFDPAQFTLASGSGGISFSWAAAHLILRSGTPVASDGEWGSLIGSLSDQTDLQAALDAKQATITVSTTAPGSPAVGDLWVDTN
jgi:hypothetical protein